MASSGSESDGEAKGASNRSTGSNLSFVTLVKYYPIICTKSQVPAVKNKRRQPHSSSYSDWSSSADSATSSISSVSNK